MAAPARGAVRSSARLSNGVGPAGGGGGGAAGSGEGARRVRDAAAAAAAAQRRARAAERLREVEDSPRVLRDKCRRLARALRNAKHLVVYTGAGISTAADIPDYRGPRGVWTRLQRGETVGRVEVSRAQPTFTHMALTALWARGTLKFVVSQNCDGLHVRGGLPRRALAELHGNMFAERCAACRRVYLRAFDTTERTARHAHATRRLCHACGAELADTIVHFGERGRAAWPLNWAGALRHAALADVVLCLGSSLKVLRRYPRLWRMHAAPGQRPQLYIVNLQWTPKDAVAKLKINARCDAVMAQVARRLRLRVPRYRPRGDPLLAHAEPLAPPEAHTTRRPLLTPPPASDADGSSDDFDSDDDDESDDELPLRRLAERLRGAGAASPPPAPPAAAPPPAPAPAPRVPPLPPPPGLLHAFQVSMDSGDATILLRAEHAPSAGDARPPSRLRLFRRMRNAHPAHPAPPSGGQSFVDEKHDSVKFKQWKDEPIEFKKMDTKDFDFKDEIVESERKPWPKEEPPEPPRAPNGVHGPGAAAAAAAARRARSADAVSALAAAIIARAVLLCRGELYPGLHSIIVPPPPPPPAAGGGEGAARAGRAAAAGAGPECAWCLRRLAARRCLWYGAAACTPPERRAWRRVRARRFLCACCGPGAAAAPDPDTGGWYGKGYRKGRRRRRGR